MGKQLSALNQENIPPSPNALAFIDSDYNPNVAFGTNMQKITTSFQNKEGIQQAIIDLENRLQALEKEAKNTKESPQQLAEQVEKIKQELKKIASTLTMMIDSLGEQNAAVQTVRGQQKEKMEHLQVLQAKLMPELSAPSQNPAIIRQAIGDFKKVIEYFRKVGESVNWLDTGAVAEVGDLAEQVSAETKQTLSGGSKKEIIRKGKKIGRLTKAIEVTDKPQKKWGGRSVRTTVNDVLGDENADFKNHIENLDNQIKAKVVPILGQSLPAFLTTYRQHLWLQQVVLPNEEITNQILDPVLAKMKQKKEDIPERKESERPYAYAMRLLAFLEQRYESKNFKLFSSSYLKWIAELKKIQDMKLDWFEKKNGYTLDTSSFFYPNGVSRVDILPYFDYPTQLNTQRDRLIQDISDIEKTLKERKKFGLSFGKSDIRSYEELQKESIKIDKHQLNEPKLRQTLEIILTDKTLNQLIMEMGIAHAYTMSGKDHHAYNRYHREFPSPDLIKDIKNSYNETVALEFNVGKTLAFLQQLREKLEKMEF